MKKLLLFAITLVLIAAILPPLTITPSGHFIHTFFGSFPPDNSAYILGTHLVPGKLEVTFRGCDKGDIEWGWYGSAVTWAYVEAFTKTGSKVLGAWWPPTSTFHFDPTANFTKVVVTNLITDNPDDPNSTMFTVNNIICTK